MSKSLCFALSSALLLLIAAGCSQAPEEPPVAVIEGESAYFAELEMLGVLALSKDGLFIDSENGQERFLEILPNLYESLIDIYVIRHTAENLGIEPADFEVEERFAELKNSLAEAGTYEKTLEALGVNEEEFKETIKHQMSVEMLQRQVLGELDYAPTDSEIKDYYYQNNLQFRHPYRMRASHIFVAAPSNDEDAREKGRLRAEQLRKMIGDQPAQTFPQLARRYSQDSLTRETGGDLGFFTRGGSDLNEPFKNAAFALAEGQVSEPVPTDFGFHLIWATDHEQSLEEAEESIRQRLIVEHAREHFEQWKDEAREGVEIERRFDPAEFKFIDEPAAE